MTNVKKHIPDTLSSVKVVVNDSLKYSNDTIDVDTLGESLMHCYEHIIRLYRDMGDEKMANLFQGKYDMCRKEKERVINS